ncbi:MAG: tetratricopeptide repeat protein [Myxococcales bacterium]|nr:MAG: tetratricopeptide repeat protein [Myxococcales bacterium]
MLALASALDLFPDDPILGMLLLRYDNTTHSTQRLRIAQTLLSRDSSTLAHAFVLDAAWQCLARGDLQTSTAFLTQHSQHNPTDPFHFRIADHLKSDPTKLIAESIRASDQSVQNDSTVFAVEHLCTITNTILKIPQANLRALQLLSDQNPTNKALARALQRSFIQLGNKDELSSIDARMGELLDSVSDCTTHTRAAARYALSQSSARASAADKILLRTDETQLSDSWIARRLLGAALRTNNIERTAISRQIIAEGASRNSEKAPFALRAVSVLEFQGQSQEAANLLTKSIGGNEVSFHFEEELARLFFEMGEGKAAAEHFEAAARLCHLPSHSLCLWHHAGSIWQDEVADRTKAVAALEQAAAIDIAYSDVFDRLRRLLQDHGGLRQLAALTLERIKAGGDPRSVVELHVQLADLYQQLGKADEAKKHLELALSTEPDHLDALREFAELSSASESWEDAANAYIRIARISRDHDELRRIFLALGSIYESKTPDAKRAEAAFKRVIRIAPDDLTAMQRLAKVYVDDGNMAQAIETLSHLVDKDLDPERNRDHRLKLAQAYESSGKLRQAEQTLERARKHTPADIIVIQSLADFYDRQGATSAYAMHLNRATDDFRHAIRNDLSDAAAWHGLVRVLGWREKHDAARACASAALSTGIVDIEISKLLSPDGAARLDIQNASNDELDQLLSPEMLAPAVRTLFTLSASAMEKLFPIDLRSFKAQKIGRREKSREIADRVSALLGRSAAHVHVTESTSHLCVPISSNPLSILISRDLIETTNDDELFFLMARAIKVADSSLSVTSRTKPYDVALLLASVIHICDPEFFPPGIEIEELEVYSKHMNKYLSKRLKQQIIPHALEVSAMQNFDPGILGNLAFQLGSRFGLLLLGSAPSAVAALLKLHGHPDPSSNLARRIVAIREINELSSLISFAISEEHFEARLRVSTQKS